MKFFGHASAKPQVEGSPRQNVRCPHPVSHYVPLWENGTSSGRIVGVMCSQCGQRLAIH